MPLTVLPHRDTAGLSEGLLLVDGKWRAAADGELWRHRHPATGEEIGGFAVATVSDVDEAVRAARRAFDEGPWPRARAGERIRTLHRYSNLLREHTAELQALQALDNSVPLSFGGVYTTSVGAAADVFDHHAGWIDKLGGDTLPPYQGGDHLAMTFREPVGVVAAILPWNAPFLLFAQKLAPALAAGCTVVVKPSEYATFSVLRMVELLAEAGLPDGVVSVVTGPGATVGEALITHPAVDKISFTGSRAVGRRIVEASASTFTRVSLELGGKSPSLVFPDAPNIGLAGMTSMGTVTMGLSGQACVAHSRALVHRDVYDEFLAAAQLMAGVITYGDPFDAGTLASPLINERQLERVLGYINRGQEEGARLVTGGSKVEGDLSTGHFVQPTIFADVDNNMAIAQEEIFGPVLVVVPFTDEDEAIRLANDTEYGLGAGIYTADSQRAFRVARKLRAGTIGINGFTVEPHLPFGGFKQSGLGREGGRSAYEAYTELKTVLLPLTEELM
ncbi:MULTISPECIES: aldehyde dehydrogenase [unclassified Crossiella]|uniref:aldehyde dehydrogenase family protein n=1 Tax=unclassified Crossiella TaxID=2620835 RepID=UPI001FFE32A6|nr:MULTISPECIES: aldehyde dehydrogenase family protein [unclassified Crossiella]MCK2241981.1 aldehyde dehydrogenase family protein [Crossiella sp. S99.2]MCK2255884.1 aldehyde dehydrogenase family protein [Crossiella sp. S99.1]